MYDGSHRIAKLTLVSVIVVRVVVVVAGSEKLFILEDFQIYVTVISHSHWTAECWTGHCAELVIALLTCCFKDFTSQLLSQGHSTPPSCRNKYDYANQI